MRIKLTMSWRRMRLAALAPVLLVVGNIGTITPRARCEGLPTAAQLLDHAAAHGQKLRTFTLQLRMETSFVIRSPDNSSKTFASSSYVTLWRDGDKMSFESTNSLTPGYPFRHWWRSFDGARLWSFMQDVPGAARSVASIKRHPAWQQEHSGGRVTTDVEQSLKHLNWDLADGSFLDGKAYPDWEPWYEVVAAARPSSTQVRKDAVGGRDCFVLEAKTDRGDFTVWLDPAADFAVRRLKCAKGAEQIPQNQTEPSWSSVVTELEDIELVQVDGVWLASKGTLTVDDVLAGGEKRKRVSTAQREGIQVNPKIPDGAFGIPDVPQGTAVVDSDTRTLYYVGAGKKLVLLGHL